MTILVRMTTIVIFENCADMGHMSIQLNVQQTSARIFHHKG